MPIASDIILAWLAEDGYSLSEAGWIRTQDQQLYSEITAEKDGHRHITRAADREMVVARLGSLIGCLLEK